MNVKKIMVLVFAAMTVLLPARKADAQIIEIIAQATKKVIRQIDLKVQKLQNKTIWLQNAQKTLENKMAELKLQEISGWTQRQRDLFKSYYDELSNVKAAIRNYSKVRQVIRQQLQIADEYRSGFNYVKQQGQFTAGETESIYRVYTGIIDQSLKNLDELYMVIDPFRMQMTDGKRIELVTSVSVRMQHCLDQLRKFNRHNRQVGDTRQQLTNDNKKSKRIHGLK